MTAPHSLLGSVLAFLGFGTDTQIYQGYVEAEYVLVAPQIAGTVQTLDVKRGQTVHKGDLLYTLDNIAEKTAFDTAKAQADKAEAALADLLKAKRQPELDQLIAAQDAARAAVQLAKLNVDRDEKQINTKAISQATMDADRAALTQAEAHLGETQAALASGKLPIGRDDAIRAAQADLAATTASLATATWRLEQKKLVAPTDAFVFDTLYHEGEFIPVGQPVISLLPAPNIRLRFFVSAPALQEIALNDKVHIRDDASQPPLTAHVTYIAPQAEYSPPQLYNRDNREKLLFMVEATPDTPSTNLHPGQPVDIVVEKP